MPSPRWTGVIWLVTTALLLTVVARPLLAQPTLVILVRHGEKQAEPKDDPSLNEAGQARAQALADALAGTTPSTILVSPRKRTVETAAVVAARAHITPTVIGLDAHHVQAVAAAVMKARGVVLVVGHSNTIPAIVTALGGPVLPDLCDPSYATMFVLTPATSGTAVQVVRTAFGAADPPGASSCAPAR